jgi:hypothetical protein
MVKAAKLILMITLIPFVVGVAYTCYSFLDIRLLLTLLWTTKESSHWFWKLCIFFAGCSK